MFIKNLYIKDFKNIREIRLEFNKINSFSGETGQGKTAIVEAITLLLTNKLQDKMENYVRWGANKFIIESDFIHLNKEYSYRIECPLKGGTKNGEGKITYLYPFG